MFKNDEIKRLSLVLLMMFIIVLFSTYFINNYLFKLYETKLLENNAYIIGNIIANHPELETEVIDNILNRHASNGLEILKNYGLGDVSSLRYLDYNEKFKQEIMFYNFAFSISLFFLLGLIYFLFTKRQYKKITGISIYMNNILNNDYSMNIREYCEGDINNLKNDVYKVTVKLKEQNESSLKDKIYLEETLSDISHQLKTPLTSMYVINEILANDLSIKDKKAFLNKNAIQLERIEWLVTSLLKMSRLDSGSVILKKKSELVIDLINKSLEPLKIPMELKNIQLDIVCDQQTRINMDLNWTSEALINIIKNACEHISNNGNIGIKVTDNPIFVQIDISDNGMGINKKDLPHIFKRFYTGSNSSESIGIGLNMAKKIIDMQNGEISVETEENKGTTFSIKLYKNII